MAEFITKCPHCNADLQVQEEWGGLEVTCPLCQNNLVVAITAVGNSKKSYGLLALCNFISPGLGHIYLGQYLKAAIFIMICILTGVVYVCAKIFLRPVAPLYWLLVLSLLWMLNGVLCVIICTDSFLIYAKMQLGEYVKKIEWIGGAGKKALIAKFSSKMSKQYRSFEVLGIGVGFFGTSLAGIVYVVMNCLSYVYGYK